MREPIRYAADIANVKEVMLHGTADLSFWATHLQKAALFPYREGDKAVLILGGADAKWRGFAFRELIIGVGVCLTEGGTGLDGYYLPHAYNSSRLLAFSERTFFRTPYTCRRAARCGACVSEKVLRAFSDVKRSII